MNKEIKKLIHAFRNALVMAADTHSHACFDMPRWDELNTFPHGSCDLASNFLAKYLGEHGYESTVICLNIDNDPEINEHIHGHVFLQIGEHYVDITRNQFEDSNARIVIEKNNDSLAKLIKAAKNKGTSYYEERNINLANFVESGADLYYYVKKLANKLINDSTSE
ncbi:hypothetical protein C1052_004863 [Escherichia coli O157]|nr:hypothetical protein [Escherichia coli O157]EFA8277174.1 hypothetical protein [Escherichia coli O157]